MSHAYSFNPLDFDDVPRGSAEADGSAPQRIASTLRAAGIDAPSSLYNEALALARDGHLGQAVSRLQMLLCLDPDDADALLLLARVHAAQGRAADALARLDAAVAAGAVAPGGFRDLLEEEIRAERNREEEHRARVSAREQGEIRGLRQETRQLRSDNVRLEGEIQDILTRERNWKISTVAVALFATGVVLALMILPPVAAPG
ncbi:MAG TPA: tetratricopeptide repeat protein, partial [Myxococcota bacterium]|nr:tetratricopeptide repeat protein [Myxococcota bacterium]